MLVMLRGVKPRLCHPHTLKPAISHEGAQQLLLCEDVGAHVWLIGVACEQHDQAPWLEQPVVQLYCLGIVLGSQHVVCLAVVDKVEARVRGGCGSC
jgi:hypothetical protein